MKAIAYSICAALVGIPAIFSLVASLLSLLGVAVPFPPFLDIFFRFGSLVPPMLTYSVPRVMLIIAGYLMLLLVLRRTWLFVVKKERTPTSFSGFQKILGYVGVASFLLGFAVLALSMVIRAGSGVPAGLLMIPAMLCVPWAFFLTEALSFRHAQIESPPPN